MDTLSELGLDVDISRMRFDEAALEALDWEAAFDAMEALESGAIANPDEGRRVGHYWLRAPELAPAAEGAAIRESWARVEQLAERVHGEGKLTELLLIGVGGSALGPQLVADALGGSGDRMRAHFIDNTDPDGVDRVLARLNPTRTLALVISKSGGTAETRNGMLEVQAAFRAQGVDFASRAVAITGEGSALDRRAQEEGWLGRLPMWDWVGGRTSVTSAVGLAPMALQGMDWRSFLAGAAACDVATRARHLDNPAARLAGAWYLAGEGRGRRAMVVLPYKDRLLLLSRYLQQLVMESVGKAHDLSGAEVRHGLTVYGNKGSTDQHAFVQQLRDGPDDCFASFIAVLEDRAGASVEVEPGVTSGDYLLGFLIGTRRALTEVGRRSLTLTMRRVDARHVGALIALFERAVGLYASLVGINAYHQPGVEAGKKAAAEALALQRRILAGDPVPDDDDARLIRAHLAAGGRL